MWAPQGFPSRSDPMGVPGALTSGVWWGGCLPLPHTSFPGNLLGDRTTCTFVLMSQTEIPGSGDPLPVPSETAAADPPPGVLTVTTDWLRRETRQPSWI